MWGEKPTSVQDVYKVFVDFLAGRIQQLPWYDPPPPFFFCVSGGGISVTDVSFQPGVRMAFIWKRMPYSTGWSA